MLLNKAKKYATFGALINRDRLERALAASSNLPLSPDKSVFMGSVNVNGVDLAKRIGKDWITDPRYPGAQVRHTSYLPG